ITASKNLGAGPLVTIQTGAGQSYNGWIVGRDDNKNLALIKVVGATLPGIAFGDAFGLNAGSEMLSLGYPLSSEGKLLAANAKLAAAQQDLKTGLRFLPLDVPHRNGNTGGPAVNRQGQAMGIGMEPLFVQSLGISVTSSVVYLLSSDSILELLPLLKQGVVEMARPTPTPNPVSLPPSFTNFQGTVKVGGNTPPAGTVLHLRVVGGALGDVWAATSNKQAGDLKSDGNYFLAASASASLAGAPIEFYISGVKANETSSFTPGEFIPLNLTFP
ncbi:MAG: trypsin-like peptidase domain-containing protein, partial [Chloroflexota bacterium]